MTRPHALSWKSPPNNLVIKESFPSGVIAQRKAPSLIEQVHLKPSTLHIKPIHAILPKKMPPHIDLSMGMLCGAGSTFLEEAFLPAQEARGRMPHFRRKRESIILDEVFLTSNMKVERDVLEEAFLLGVRKEKNIFSAGSSWGDFEQ